MMIYLKRTRPNNSANIAIHAVAEDANCLWSFKVNIKILENHTINKWMFKPYGARFLNPVQSQFLTCVLQTMKLSGTSTFTANNDSICELSRKKREKKKNCLKQHDEIHHQFNTQKCACTWLFHKT